MLIEVHYGDGCILLVNGNCRSINLLDYLRRHCCLSSEMNIDLCLINSGEPFYLSSSDTKNISFDKRRFPFHSHCILTKIDEDGTYIPLLNDPTLITNEFLGKLKRATTIIKPPPPPPPVPQPKSNPKSVKQPINPPIEKPKRRRSFKSLAILATFFTKSNH